MMQTLMFAVFASSTNVDDDEQVVWDRFYNEKEHNSQAEMTNIYLGDEESFHIYNSHFKDIEETIITLSYGKYYDFLVSQTFFDNNIQNDRSNGMIVVNSEIHFAIYKCCIMGTKSKSNVYGFVLNVNVVHNIEKKFSTRIYDSTIAQCGSNLERSVENSLIYGCSYSTYRIHRLNVSQNKCETIPAFNTEDTTTGIYQTTIENNTARLNIISHKGFENEYDYCNFVDNSWYEGELLFARHLLIRNSFFVRNFVNFSKYDFVNCKKIIESSPLKLEHFNSYVCHAEYVIDKYVPIPTPQETPTPKIPELDPTQEFIVYKMNRMKTNVYF